MGQRLTIHCKWGVQLFYGRFFSFNVHSPGLRLITAQRERKELERSLRPYGVPILLHKETESEAAKEERVARKRAYVHSVPLEGALLDHPHLAFLRDLKTASTHLLPVNKSLIEASPPRTRLLHVTAEASPAFPNGISPFALISSASQFKPLQ